MKPNSKVVLAIAAAVALSIPIAARQAGNGNAQSTSGMQGMQDKQGMPMNKMMQMCRQNMGSMMQSNDQLKKDIEAAKQSNDPSKMRAALDEAEKALDSLSDHMNMMNKMRNMRGTRGKMCGGMMSDQQNNDQEQN